ncbi:LysR substrate-binding domain-containing protein [Notoacmeibacter ruber]|uniref:LysR family transcriptional regulator n=1 Tax=Notoacmeibacter ruber TaxID=2670375 RepID=A0A3L7JHU4_9HYPH|nr:LysR substrate-binding domain-containing protein [Notoacmeibacter ruber]RLQ89191.1 LysR family transcriptional regulator [Notoacmeibacter ruber]
MLTPAPLPSLAILRCFEAAAKHQSFTAAAEELGLSQGAVSRHVKELEDQVGARLFRREGRGVRLTDAGRDLSAHLLSDLERLRGTIARAVAAGNSARLLSIAVLPTFGSRWLVPRLKDFKAGQDDLELVIHSRSEPFDLVESGIDLAIHFGSDDWPGAQLTPLCREDLIAVAAPDLIERFGLLQKADLFRMPLLHLSSRPMLWESFRQTVDKAEGATRKGSYFDQFALIISAAVAGLGAAILPAYLIETELQNGLLVPLESVPDTYGRSYYIATPAGLNKPLTAQFSRWIRKQVSHLSHDGPEGGPISSRWLKASFSERIEG